MIGSKLLDGLQAYAEMERRRLDAAAAGHPPGLRNVPFADALLEARGYPPKVADSIIDRLDRRGWIMYGVSARSGWLTPQGWAALATAPS